MENNILCKCKCGENVICYDTLYECKGCKAKVWKTSFGKEFKDHEAKKLFRGETFILKGLRSSNNTLYDTKGKLEEGKLKLLFDDDTRSTTMFRCSCGGEVTKINGGYKCHSCNQVIWERFLNKMLTFRQVKRLFKGESLQLTNLKSQRGNRFNAEIFYTDNELSLEYL